MNDIVKLWIGVINRGFAVGGFTFFSLAVQNGICLNNLMTGLIAGGFYLFTEALRQMRIDPTKINKKGTFLIFP